MKIRGRVDRGRGIGRKLGYPTANMAVEADGALAATHDGVYAAWVWREAKGADAGTGAVVERRYGAMVNLGVKPTFESGGERMMEVHLLDFEGDLYGERLAVEPVSFIRPERKFASAEELAAQIAQDKTVVERALARAAGVADDADDAAANAAAKEWAGGGNLTFERLTDTDHPLFDAAWKLYIKSFPPEERRQLRTQRKIMNDAPYHFELIVAHADGTDGGGKKGGKDGKTSGALVGILLWWGFADMRYVEHFATVPEVRGRGCGARALAAFTARSAVPVVLEVELPTTELSRRRVGFYRRQGFVASDRPYTHPPYKRGGERVALMLMTHPAPITDEQYRSFLDTHHPVIHRFAM